jgi:hypothetical protein
MELVSYKAMAGSLALYAIKVHIYSAVVTFYVVPIRVGIGITFQRLPCARCWNE